MRHIPDDLHPDGDTAVAGIGFRRDPNTGLYRPSNDTIAFAIGGSEKLRLDANGLSSDAGATYFGKPTAYTPTLTASSSNPVLGTGSTAEGWYTRVGKEVHYWGCVIWGTTTNSGGSGTYRIQLPVLMDTTYYTSTRPIIGYGHGFDTSSSITKAMICRYNQTAGPIPIINFYQSIDNVLTTDTLVTNTSVIGFGGTGDELLWDITYIGV